MDRQRDRVPWREDKDGDGGKKEKRAEMEIYIYIYIQGGTVIYGGEETRADSLSLVQDKTKT